MMKNTLAIIFALCMLFSCSSDESESEIPKNSNKQIVSFVFRASDNDVLSSDILTQIDENAKTITALIISQSPIEFLVPEIVISDKASVTPTNDSAQDFSKPIQYKVEAEDKTTAVYTVTVVVKSNANTMSSFVFKAADNNGLTSDIVATIDQTSKKVKATVPFGVDSRFLVPTITFSENAVVEPKSGEQKDFTKQLGYVVVAENGLRNNYNVVISVNISEKERNALKAISLANPSNTLNWDFSDPNNVSWGGVGLDNGTVKSLMIYTNHNIVKIPTEIGDLVNMTSLVIRDNLQIGVFPESIKNLKNLEELNLTLTGIKGFPMGITSMTKLKKLNLSNNTIGQLPSEIGNLKNLEEFRVSYSSLTNFPVALTTLVKLKTLDIFSNFGIKNVPSEIGNLVNLTYLSLHGSSITLIPPTIGNLTKLEYLDIAVNKLSTVPSELGNLVNLKKLFLRTNKLNSLPIEIGNLIKLTELEIWGNTLTSIPQKICDLKNTGTKITKDDGVTCN